MDQRNYENGRQRAANYRLATGGLPALHPPSPAYIAAIRAVGPAFYSPRDPHSIVPLLLRREVTG
jgi:hypothetical protein